jgi:hypothetical protein
MAGRRSAGTPTALAPEDTAAGLLWLAMNFPARFAANAALTSAR